MVHYAVAASTSIQTRHPVQAVLLGVPEYSPSQQTDGRVLVSTLWHRQYCAQLEQAKWVNILDLEVCFHNIQFESTSFYDLTFVTHQGKFQWLRILMGLM